MNLKGIRKFLRLESASGIILFVMAIVALSLANSPFAELYQKSLQTSLTIHFKKFYFEETVLFWINDGLMTLFFFLVGLELKKEILYGELSRVSQVILPGVAAIGGIVLPAIIYCLFNHGNDEALRGWSIPVATDIAFALGVLSLFGQRVPHGLKLFLMALAVFDDVGAILIIALFYSDSVSAMFLSFAAIVVACLMLLNKWNVKRLIPYLLLGLLLWTFILKSGVHATISGVLLALFIPAKKKVGERHSPLNIVEETLHPWVAYLVMPLFALANAGLSIAGLSADSLLHPVFLGIVCALFFGKQVGVMGITWLIVRLKWSKLPRSTDWFKMYGVALLCGVGFTMSLFLGMLAFKKDSALLVEMRLGVLTASFLSSVIGALVLHYALPSKAQKEN